MTLFWVCYIFGGNGRVQSRRTADVFRCMLRSSHCRTPLEMARTQLDHKYRKFTVEMAFEGHPQLCCIDFGFVCSVQPRRTVIACVRFPPRSD